MSILDNFLNELPKMVEPTKFTEIKIFHEYDYHNTTYNIYGEGNENTFYDEDELITLSVPKKEYEEYLENLKKLRALNKCVQKFKDNCLALAIEKRGDMFPNCVKEDFARREG